MLSNVSTWWRAGILAVGVLSSTAVGLAQGFLPLSPDDLKMTSEPHAPGAPAVVLFREVDRNDNADPPNEDNYVRIKVLTEAGRKFANVEIESSSATRSIDDIRARTIHTDGTIIPFDGKVFEKTVVKAKGVRYLAKVFVLPDVQVGSVIEYYYTVHLDPHYLWSSDWILSDELFTRHARFTLTPTKVSGKMSLRRSWQNVPPGNEPREGPNHTFTMDVHNVPAFEIEDFMPPLLEVVGRVTFIYENAYFERDPTEYWHHVANDWNRFLEVFVGKRKAMEEAVATIVSPADSPDVKLRKIYERVQKLRNTSYERAKTAQEGKRDKEKFAENVEQVWKHGYGTAVQLTWLFLGLVRAAGFDAHGVWVSSRRDYFFQPKTMESRKLDANIVQVKLDGKDLYFDPGAALTPFGMLAWFETGTEGLLLDGDGGTWVKTPLPRSSESRTENSARFKLNESGTLDGSVKVTYTGLEAMYRRLDVLNNDGVARKKYLEDAVRELIPQTAEVELTNEPDWQNPATPLIAEFKVSIPEWGSKAGKREVVPVSIFSAGEKGLFDRPHRTQPIYFAYPYEKDDDVVVELPKGWRASSVPQPQEKTGPDLGFHLTVENNRQILRLTRKVSVDVFLLAPSDYPMIRDFFQTVRTSDEQQILLEREASAAD